MRRMTTAVAAMVGALALSGCAGDSDPKSLDDLVKVVEKAGYECGEPEDTEPGARGVECGPDGTLHVHYFESSTKEAEAWTRMDEFIGDLPVSFHAVRGNEWQIRSATDSGKAGVKKIAEQMGKEVSRVGN